MKQNLALFDFDGTISYRDSMIEFLKYLKGTDKLYKIFFLHSHWLILMYLGLIKKYKVKEKIWVKIFGSTKIDEFNQRAKQFALEVLPTFLFQSAINQIKKHKEEGDRVIVVSASAENWLQPWCEINELELISTVLEVQNGRLTGHIEGKNCNGLEKVVRIKQQINLNKFDKIYAYGNSKGDIPMLNLATHQFFNHFKN